MNKNILLNILKFSFAIGLVYWLVTSGRLDFTLAKDLFVISIILIMFFDQFLVAYRWAIILSTKSENKLSQIKVFYAHWIGIFFSSVLPGSISGDLIKIFYVKGMDKNFSNTFLLGSIFLDRLLGFFGLISLGGIVSLFNYKNLISLSPAVKHIIHFNLLLFLIVILSFLLIFFMPKLPLMISKVFRKVKKTEFIFIKLESIWNDLCMIKTKLLYLFFISTLIQSISSIILFFVVSKYTSSFSVAKAMTIMPIGSISMSIPIAPAGLGVGHAAFHTLFGYFGIQNGASLFNIYFILVILTNLTGVIPYLIFKRTETNFKSSQI